MRVIGGVLMITGLGLILSLVLSLFGLLPQALGDWLPSGWDLYGLGIGLIVGGSILRACDGIFQSALNATLDAVKETKRGEANKDESDTSH